MHFKVVINGVDGEETLSLDTRKVQVVRTILKQYDHEGSSIHLEIHLEGEEIYKVLRSEALREVETPRAARERTGFKSNVDDLVESPRSIKIAEVPKRPSTTSPSNEIYSMGVKEIKCTSCGGKFVLQEHERTQRYIDCPHCEDTLDSETYPHEELA